MDWQFVTHHLVSGYIPVVVALVLYYILLFVMGEKQTIHYLLQTYPPGICRSGNSLGTIKQYEAS